ncbi:ribbon-helix-helix protein, CopG family [Salinibacter altiplanensis]|uniref:ribbon-helix-helix protein, CopG family n=1 Tax=Salinibacter altiplanensis TaxID=1803181 RepID=UPI000C9FA295|nr:ribbon-helix-helix protein, CopG family [Salinibacter altiplanensis]
MSNRFEDAVQDTQDQEAPEGTEDAAKEALGETEGDTTRLNVRVPTPLYERFKDKVDSEGRTMTWVVLQAIREYLQ